MVVALKMLKDAAVPLNVTEEAFVKSVPVRVILVPAAPTLGLKLVRVGADWVLCVVADATLLYSELPPVLLTAFTR
jgi:hypothetical protein